MFCPTALLRVGPGPAPRVRSWRPSVKAHKCRKVKLNRRAVQTLEQSTSAEGHSGEEASAAVVLYDPDREHSYFQQKQLLVGWRMANVTWRTLQFMSVVFSDRVEAAVMGTERSDHRAARTLQEAVTKLGPCFVKLAQTLSMRPDLIGEAYASSLSELQDSVAPFSNEEAFAILEQELGRPVSEVFSYISPEPVASASLGQVYRAVLADSGRDVAVKIQRPGVEATVALDVYLLRKGIGVAQKAAGITRDLRVVADEIGRTLYGELDFRLEAVHGEEFLQAHRSLDFVCIPEVVKELTTRRVLVMEWVDGQSPTQLLSRSGAAARQRILSMVRMGIQCSLSQLLVTGVMHGDPHSGNLLLTRDGRLCYLDFGALVRITSQHRQAMMCALIHLGLGEWRRLVDDLAALDLLKPGTNRMELADDLELEFMAVLSQAEGTGPGPAPTSSLNRQLPLLSLQTSALSFGTLTAVLFRVAFKYKFLLPPYFPLVVRSVASLEGVALLVDPDFKLISAGMPIVLNQLLSDRRPAAQQLLRELLLGPGGAVRTDATAQQIMQVWARARQQEAAAVAEDARAVVAMGGSEHPLMLGAAAGALGAAAGALSHMGSLSSMDDAADVWEGEAANLGASSGSDGSNLDLDLAGLLLARQNAPLRRVLMDVNPAATVASMAEPMRQVVRQLAVDLLAPISLMQLLSAGRGDATARAQRKRLSMMMRASARQVARSPLGSIVQLVLFTVQIAAAVAAAKLQQAVQKLVGQMQRVLQRREDGGGSAAPQVRASFA